MSRARAAAIALVALTSMPAMALAQPEPPVEPETAAAWLERGSQLYVEDADYPAALAAFEKSHALEPSWRALNGVGLSHTALGHYVEAYEAYDKLLRDFAGTLSAEQRTAAEAKRLELDGKIARLEVRLADPGGARVTLDGSALEAASARGPHLVLPGSHAVVVIREGFQPFAEEVVVKPGERRAVNVELVPEKEKIVVQIEEAPLERRMPGWIPYATIAGGAALAGVGGLFALGARSDFNEFDEQVAAAAGPVPRSVEAPDPGLRDAGETKRDVAIGLFVAGGVAAAVGITLAFLNQPRRVGAEDKTTAGTATLLVSPRHVGVSIAF